MMMADFIKNNWELFYYFFIGINIGALLMWLYWKSSMNKLDAGIDGKLHHKDDIIRMAKEEMFKYQSELKKFCETNNQLNTEVDSLRETVNKLPELDVKGRFIHRQLQDLRDDVQGLITCIQRLIEDDKAEVSTVSQMIEKFSTRIWMHLPMLKSSLLNESSEDVANSIIAKLKGDWNVVIKESNIQEEDCDDLATKVKTYHELILNIPALY